MGPDYSLRATVEQVSRSAMERLTSLVTGKQGEHQYGTLGSEPSDAHNGADSDAGSDADPLELESDAAFSWVEYAIFTLLGVAMLWAWNMFIAAAPYFQARFMDDEWALNNFQSAIVSVSTLTNLSTMAILANMQASASYPFRIQLALYVSIVVFVLLTISTRCFLEIAPALYLGFVLCMVALSAWASAMVQNGALGFAASFSRPEYMQAIMAGQAVAGVLPPLVQVLSVLAAPAADPSDAARLHAITREEGTTAFIYFLTAVVMSALCALAFFPLHLRHNRRAEGEAIRRMTVSFNSIEESEEAARKHVGMMTLLKKLRWLAGGVFMCFVVSMFFPVFTPKVMSVAPVDEANRLQMPAGFISLGFLFWNIGDLSGRGLALVLPCQKRPGWLFIFSIARFVFIPLYGLCNLHGKGAIVNSDLFYLLVVQGSYGMTTGWLASNCMMAAGDYVDDEERAASGGFMGLCLVAGLAFGSLLTFTAAGV